MNLTHYLFQSVWQLQTTPADVMPVLYDLQSTPLACRGDSDGPHRRCDRWVSKWSRPRPTGLALSACRAGTLRRLTGTLRGTLRRVSVPPTPQVSPCLRPKGTLSDAKSAFLSVDCEWKRGGRTPDGEEAALASLASLRPSRAARSLGRRVGRPTPGGGGPISPNTVTRIVPVAPKNPPERAGAVLDVQASRPSTRTGAERSERSRTRLRSRPRATSGPPWRPFTACGVGMGKSPTKFTQVATLAGISLPTAVEAARCGSGRRPRALWRPPRAAGRSWKHSGTHWGYHHSAPDVS